MNKTRIKTFTFGGMTVSTMTWFGWIFAVLFGWISAVYLINTCWFIV